MVRYIYLIKSLCMWERNIYFVTFKFTTRYVRGDFELIDIIEKYKESIDNCLELKIKQNMNQQLLEFYMPAIYGMIAKALYFFYVIHYFEALQLKLSSITVNT